MRSNVAGEGNAAADVLSTDGDGTTGDSASGLEDGTAAPAVRIVGGTGVRGDGAAGTGTVAFATVAANFFPEACLVSSKCFSGSAARTLQLPEVDKWA